MENVTVFENNDFGQVRTLLRDGEPWFVAVDVCKALDVTDTGKATSRLEDDELTRIKIESGGQMREVIVVNEPGLYSLVLSSRKPEARAFKRWITHDVIPSIRKTGSYNMTPVQFLEENFSSFSDETKRGIAIDLCKRNVELEKEHALLTTQIEEQKPAVEFADQVSSSEQTLLIRDFCKIIQKKGIVISDRKLYQWFIDNGYLNKNKLPYQKYREYFEVTEWAIHTPHGVELKHTTRITGKGQVYFTKKILDSMKMDLMCV